MRCKSIFVLVFVMLFIGLASASFEFSEHGSGIVDKYQPSETLQADINISFLNQSLSSIFTDSFGNYMSLNEILSGNPDYHTIFFDISNTSVSSAFQILSFNGTGFQMPSTEGSFTYTLSLGDETVFSKPFEVVSSGSAIEEALQQKKSQLNASKSEISSYDSYTQHLLNQFLNISIIESELEYIENNYETLSVEEQNELLTNISLMKIPKKITETAYSNPMVFYPERNNINLDILAEIEGGYFSGNQEEYLDAVYLWNNENLITTITFEEIGIEYASGEKENVRLFIFSFERLGDTSDAYFVIQNLDSLIFEDLSLPIQQYGGYLYLRVNEVYENLGILTTEDINFINVPAFISPSISGLTPVSVGEYERWEAQKKWLLFGLIIFILLFIGAVSYILVQIWYRKKYETYLFKTKNNMYNIMVYIHNSKLKGVSNEDIEKNLKKAGWSKEQINYAMQKYSGKRIAGMIHPPMNIGSNEPKKVTKMLPKKNPVKR